MPSNSIKAMDKKMNCRMPDCFWCCTAEDFEGFVWHMKSQHGVTITVADLEELRRRNTEEVTQ